MTPEPRPEDMWVAVSARGKGQPVRVVTNNGHHVYFKAVGRGADQSQRFKLPVGAFKVRYAPVQQAEERQKRLAQEERWNEGVVIDGEPVASWTESLVVEPVLALAGGPPPSATLPAPPHQPTHSAKLTGDQAREIYLLVKDGGNRREIGAAYGVLPQTVHDIWNGKSYRWAVQDLLEARGFTAPREFSEEPVSIPSKFATIRPGPEAPIPAELLTDLADALELLLEYHGKPVPRFLVVNRDAVAGVIKKAREHAAAKE